MARLKCIDKLLADFSARIPIRAGSSLMATDSIQDQACGIDLSPSGAMGAIARIGQTLMPVHQAIEAALPE